jgi:hypothetical protein
MFAKYKFVLSKLTIVIISVPTVVVGTYADPDCCNTDVGNDTVPEPVVFNLRLTV